MREVEKLLCVIAITWILVSDRAYADLNQNRAYIDLKRPIPCIRRFNSTHQTGCSGQKTGVVYAVRNSIEFTRLITHMNASTMLGLRPLIVIAYPQWFVRVIDWWLAATSSTQSILAGLVLAQTDDDQTVSLTPPPYSDDSVSPNLQFSIYPNNSFVWNPNGRATGFMNFKIPIYVITDRNEANQPFIDCYDKFNRVIFERNPLKIESTDQICGMQLGLDMSGAISSRVCIRRSNIIHTLDINYFCDPLGGSTYFTPLLGKSSNNTLPILILSARLDTFTLFEAYTPGANEPISALIGILVLAELLAPLRAHFDRFTPLFTLFDNEAFDYGGSSRFVRDILNGDMPIFDLLDGKTTYLDKNNLIGLIELYQLGSIGLKDENKLYIHKDPVSYKANQTIASLVDDLINKLQNYSNGQIVSAASIQLPPSSSHSFLRFNISLATISITDFNASGYSNPFYHSVFDTAYNFNIRIPDNLTEPNVYAYTTRFAQRLAPVIFAIAQVIYATGSSIKDASLPLPPTNVTLDLINRLVYCFYKNNSCIYFRSILSDSQWSIYKKLLDASNPSGHLSFYTSVNDNLISGKFLSLQLLRYFTRIRELDSLNATECTKDSQLVKNFQSANNVSLKGFAYIKSDKSPKCVVNLVRLTTAVSPAFDKDGELTRDDIYSAWTESSWTGIDVQMRMFIFSQAAVSGVTLALGIVVTLVALALSLVFNKYAGQWFLIKSTNTEQSTEFIH